MSQDTEIFAAKVGAEMLRRKYSINRDGTKLVVGLGEYFLIEVEIEEEDVSIDEVEFADLLTAAFKKHLDRLHQEDLDRFDGAPEPEKRTSLPEGARIVEDIDVKPKTIRDHVQREFVRVRSERLKRHS